MAEATRRANVRRLLPAEIEEVSALRFLAAPQGPGVVVGPGTRKLLAGVERLGARRVGGVAAYKRDPETEEGLPSWIVGDRGGSGLPHQRHRRRSARGHEGHAHPAPGHEGAASSPAQGHARTHRVRPSEQEGRAQARRDRRGPLPAGRQARGRAGASRARAQGPRGVGHPGLRRRDGERQHDARGLRARGDLGRLHAGLLPRHAPTAPVGAAEEGAERVHLAADGVRGLQGLAGRAARARRRPAHPRAVRAHVRREAAAGPLHRRSPGAERARPGDRRAGDRHRGGCVGRRRAEGAEGAQGRSEAGEGRRDGSQERRRPRGQGRSRRRSSSARAR